jgi:hypothetical protein
MKKITILVLSIFAMASAASAQVVVSSKDFIKDFDKYIGQTITIKGVNLRPKTLFENIADVKKSQFLYFCDSAGPQTTGPKVNWFPKCRIYKGQKLINVELPSNSKWTSYCFYITDELFSSLPVSKSTIKSNITFSVHNKSNIKTTGFFITGLPK